MGDEPSLIDVPLVLDAEPRLICRPGTSDALAHLAMPVVVEPGGQTELWLQWPLELALVGAGSQPVSVGRPGMRKALFGTVSEGRILSAVRVALLDGPEAVDSPGQAALHVVLTNVSSEAVFLRRIPISQGELQAATRGQRAVLGTVRISVADAGRAEARVEALARCPEGFELHEMPEHKHRGLKLDWLLDATRRSTEFQL